MPPDAARYAAMSDPDQNPAFQRLWEDPQLPGNPGEVPPPFVSIGDAAQRVLAAMNPASEERLARQVREVFGDH